MMVSRRERSQTANQGGTANRFDSFVLDRNTFCQGLSYFQEEFMVYVTQVDLTGIKLEETNKKNSWLPWGIPLIIAVAAVLVFFIIKLVKLKKKNDSLQLEMKSLAFSNDIQTNVLIKEKNISKNESDYESTFI